MTETSRRRVGIRDVAKAAGVSTAMVSQVLNETPDARASAETRERVKRTARELGYTPNRLARGLRTRTSQMIGLLTEEIAATAYAGGIILGAQDAAERHNLTIAIVNSALQRDSGPPEKDVNALIDRLVDGIIYATVYHDVVSPPPEMAEVPSVLVGASDNQGRLPSIRPDERSGAKAAVEYLIAAGHKRIGFIDRSDDVPATRGRKLGYVDALAEAGFVVEAKLTASGEAEARGGYLAAIRLLKTRNRPSALFCYNDRMCMGVYHAASELGLSIPSDLAVIGFDNQEPIASSLFPALTTVALPHYEMGAWAVETLVKRIQHRMSPKGEAPLTVLQECSLIERDSVATVRIP